MFQFAISQPDCNIHRKEKDIDPSTSVCCGGTIKDVNESSER